MLERLGGEVAQAVAGGLGAGQGAAVGQTLAGQDAAVEAVNDALVLAEEVADLAGTDADIAGGRIGELADMAVELRHEALAEAHDLRIGLALRVKVGAALAAAHGERGQRVLQDLLKAQELDDGEVHAGMEAKTALVGANGGIKLNAVTAVDADVAGVVDPGNTEFNHTLGLDKALEQAGLFPFGVLVDYQLQGLEDLPYCLQKLRLMAVTTFDVFIDALEILVVQHKRLLLFVMYFPV